MSPVGCDSEIEDIDQECVQTFEELKLELALLEDQLAVKFRISRQAARRVLLAMAREGTLNEEDETVERWQNAYAVYADWLRWEVRNRPPPPRVDEAEQRAAEAALAALWAPRSFAVA